MPESREEHRIFIVNEANEAPFVTPKTLPVKRGDKVLFVVAGEAGEFRIVPKADDMFQSICTDDEICADLGSPPRVTVDPEAPLNSVKRYEVRVAASKEIIDPILVIYD